ncbi:MAG: TonB-dependent receptor domain-containing protein [Bacteroidales bacterium]
MQKIYLILFLLTFTVSVQASETGAIIKGHILSEGHHLPYATVTIKGTNIGTATDGTGHYLMGNLPEGRHTIVASMIGYKAQEVSVVVVPNTSFEINFNLPTDHMNLEEVIVSADRSEQKRTEAPVIVNTISPRIFNSSQSNSFGEGLNFSPGLRIENNCQNCGFTQVRMSGMEGPYSQILINSRPVFSGLAGVYGLELIPANMIEKVEVVRGGGSALYGSNAIAGTINIILKEPVRNSYEVGSTYSSVGTGLAGSGGIAPDYNFNINTSIVSDDYKTGITLYGFTRNRSMFDANNDGFSEIAPLNNLTAGTRLYHRFAQRSKLTFDLFTINENREGGNRHEYPLHERDVAEAVAHDLKMGSVTYDQFLRENDLLSVFVSGQFLKRDSYYGANRSLSDYGHSKDNTYNIGAQYKMLFNNSSLITGIENTGGFLVDKKLGYFDYENAVIGENNNIEVPHTENTIVADQSSITSGLYAQYESTFNKTRIAVGGRFDHYQVKDLAGAAGTKTGNVFSPRVSLMHAVLPDLQARISYAWGYRAPQIFDEDLHIETSGSRQVINVNDPGLIQETSQSISGSFDFNKLIGSIYTGLLLEGFYTRLDNPFVNEIGEPDDEGTVFYTRTNAEDGATVTGMNIELKLQPVNDISFTSGFTMQSSKYDVEQEFGERRFFRTPNKYGYFVINWNVADNFNFASTGNYTGRMLVPYFGTETDPDDGELRETENFFDLGFKLDYTFRLSGTAVQVSSGIKNIFNSFQSDFDRGIDRDPAYMYGPMSPRTIYFGVKFGNFLN